MSVRAARQCLLQLAASGSLVLLAACGGVEETPGTQTQMERMPACSARMQHYQRMGVWLHGGARPGVDRAAWDALSDSQQEEVFAIAACIAAGGARGERSVTVTEEGGFGEIGTRRMPNQRDF